jgi:U3 small nucleolar RNA-associated protein 10
MRNVYRLSNSLSSNLKKCLLSTLFVTLKSDALLFFAGIWLSESKEKDSPVLKRLALNHAQTFLEAAAEDNTDTGVDFQTVVPSVLIALRDHNADVRKAAVALLGLIKKTTAEKKFGTVYAFDLVYGSSESEFYSYPVFTAG